MSMGGHYAASLGNLLQSLVTLVVKNFFSFLNGISDITTYAHCPIMCKLAEGMLSHISIN